MTGGPNAKMGHHWLVRRRFVLIGAAILIIGALSVPALWDYIVSERAEPTTSGAGSGPALALANPASTSCAKKGGTSEVRNGENGETGYCRFADGRVCEEWALFREGRCASPAAGR